MKNRELVIYGAWYFSDLVSELAAEQGWNVVGCIDPQPPKHMVTLDEYPEGASCFIAIGNNALRRYVTEQLELRSRHIISLVHESAAISGSAVIGAGCYIGENAVIRTKSVLGRGVIVNAGVVLSHHLEIGDFVACGPNVAIASRVTVRSETLIGVGACVRPASLIGENCTIGAGAVVVSHIPGESVVIGNPARPVQSDTPRARERQSDWKTCYVW